MPSVYLTITEVVSDSRARARSAQMVLSSGEEITPQIRAELGRLADRVAVDLARAERDLAMCGLS